MLEAQAWEYHGSGHTRATLPQTGKLQNCSSIVLECNERERWMFRCDASACAVYMCGIKYSIYKKVVATVLSTRGALCFVRTAPRAAGAVSTVFS